MDDVKDKVKGLMKKVNNPFSSSSSGKFKGQGRVLGSSSSSSSSSSVNSISTPRPRPSPSQNPNPNPNPKPTPTPTPTSSIASNHTKTEEKYRKPGDGFDPFDSLVTSSQRSQNGYSLNVYECPICKKPFRSEEEVSEHVDTCLNNQVENNDDGEKCVSEASPTIESNSELEICIGTYISGNPSEGSIDIVLKLLRNIGREPENVKFRKIRLSNPKIKEAVGDVTGGVELLSFLGFELKEENGETWALMETPVGEQINLIKKAVVLLESQIGQEPPKRDSLVSTTSAQKDVQAEPKRIDRQVTSSINDKLSF